MQPVTLEALLPDLTPRAAWKIILANGPKKLSEIGAALRAAGRPLTPKSLRVQACKLAAESAIVRVSFGVYALPKGDA